MNNYKVSLHHHKEYNLLSTTKRSIIGEIQKLLSSCDNKRLSVWHFCRPTYL